MTRNDFYTKELLHERIGHEITITGKNYYTKDDYMKERLHEVTITLKIITLKN